MLHALVHELAHVTWKLQQIPAIEYQLLQNEATRLSQQNPDAGPIDSSAILADQFQQQYITGKPTALTRLWPLQSRLSSHLISLTTKLGNLSNYIAHCRKYPVPIPAPESTPAPAQNEPTAATDHGPLTTDHPTTPPAQNEPTAPPPPAAHPPENAGPRTPGLQNEANPSHNDTTSTQCVQCRYESASPGICPECGTACRLAVPTV